MADFDDFSFLSKNNIESVFQAKYAFHDLGYNFRPTEITGFLGRYQLKFLKNHVKKRENNYITLESVVKKNPELVVINRKHISVLSAFGFPVLCKSPEIRKKYFKNFSNKVEIRPMIAGNIQLQPFYKKYVSKHYDLKGAERIHNCGFYCGNYPELTADDIQTFRSCLNGD